MEPGNFSNYEFNLPKKEYLYQNKTQVNLSNLMSFHTNFQSILLYHSVGVGKCHARDTGIITTKGVKLVQDITTKDILVGDDGSMRHIKSLASGVDKMYTIKTDQESFTVNSEHILCLRYVGSKNVVEMTVNDYLKLSEPERRKLRGYRTGVYFPYKSVSADPYTCGSLLSETGSFALNHRVLRLNYLAGVIDHHGELSDSGYMVPFTQKILFIVRSLGFLARVSTDAVFIQGDIHVIPSKKFRPRYFSPADLNYAFTVTSAGSGRYYGFVLTGNCRYLISDFTVTHNTCSAISIAEANLRVIQENGRRVLVLVKNGNIKRNFLNELDTKCGGNLKRSCINFMTYGAFTSNANKNLDFNVNGTVVIVDEVHNVTGNDYYFAIQRVLSNSTNYKLVLMSATPVYDNVREIAEIANLLNAHNPVFPIRNELLNKGYIRKQKGPGLNLLKTSVFELSKTGEKLLRELVTHKVSFAESNKDSFPKVTTNNLEVVMSEYQSEVYKKALNLDNSDSSLYHNSTFASVIVYPGDLFGKEGFLECFQATGKRYKVRPDYKNVITTDLQKYSAKLYRLVQEIKNSKGLVFIYSNYVEYNGVQVLKEVLSANGLSSFAVYDSSYSSAKRECIRKKFNSFENKDGELIKILIGSPSVSEGITLKNVRQVHILEPGWNESGMEQIAGRAARFESHKDLPEDEREVTVFRYTAVPTVVPAVPTVVPVVPAVPTVPSIDSQKYLLSKLKEIANKKVKDILKEGNVSNLEKVKLPGDTYYADLHFYERFEIDFVRAKLEKVFTKLPFASLTKLVSEFGTTKRILYNTVSDFAKNKTPVYLYGVQGYLSVHGDYIVFTKRDASTTDTLYKRVYDFSEKKNDNLDLSKWALENLKIDVRDKRVKKTKTVDDSVTQDVLDYNEAVQQNLLYGTFRKKGTKGKLGVVDNKFRIVDNRNTELQDDERKIITGIWIGSIKKPDLYDILDYLGESCNEKDSSGALSEKIQSVLKERGLVLR